MSFKHSLTDNEARCLGSLCRNGGVLNFSQLKNSLCRMDKLEKLAAFESLKAKKIIEIKKKSGAIGRRPVMIYLIDDSVCSLIKEDKNEI